MSKYSTTAGVPTRGDAFAKLIHHLQEAADQAAVLSHLHNTEDSQIDRLVAKGWLGVHELILRMIAQITKLAMNKFQ
jgi:aromatic ring-cleaving dioxygenase